MFLCGTIFLIFTLDLILVNSHVISEINAELENSKFNAFIDSSENSQVNNFELHHNETSKDPENSPETSTLIPVTNHDEVTIIHVAEHHKKEPSKIKDFPLSEFHKDIESSTIPLEYDYQPATVESTSTILESEKAIETTTMKIEQKSTAREQKEIFPAAKSSEQIKIHKTETFPTTVSTTNEPTTIKPKPTPSNATSLKINFGIFLMIIFAWFL